MPDYSSLKLPFLPTDNPDADQRIFHACFTILGQYVEEELNIKAGYKEYRGYALSRILDLESAPNTDKQAIDLWLWYKHELPALEDDDNFKTFDKTESLKAKKLAELMAIRPSLWT